MAVFKQPLAELKTFKQKEPPSPQKRSVKKAVITEPILKAEFEEKNDEEDLFPLKFGMKQKEKRDQTDRDSNGIGSIRIE